MSQEVIIKIMRRLRSSYLVEFDWDGDLSFDTRPWAVVFDEDGGMNYYMAPVAYTQRVEEEEGVMVTSGDVWGWLTSLPTGSLLICPAETRKESRTHWVSLRMKGGEFSKLIAVDTCETGENADIAALINATYFRNRDHNIVG